MANTRLAFGDDKFAGRRQRARTFVYPIRTLQLRGTSRRSTLLPDLRRRQEPRRAPKVRPGEWWILDRNSEGPFTFQAICETLGIEPDLLIARHRPLGSAYGAGVSTVPSTAIDNSPLNSCNGRVSSVRQEKFWQL
jgi:hypothetical protein